MSDALYRCPTLCDDDCEINGRGCHEAHDVPSHREHDPGACEAQALAANLRWLVGDGREVRIGQADPLADPLVPFYVQIKPGRASWILHGVGVGDVLLKAREWAQVDTARIAGRQA